MSDDINNPEWYTEGGMDTDSYIGAKRLSWRRGQIIKYVTRAGKKPGNEELADLQKAQWFLEKEIRQLELDRERLCIYEDTRGHEEAEREAFNEERADSLKKFAQNMAHLTNENPGGCADPLYPESECAQKERDEQRRMLRDSLDLSNASIDFSLGNSKEAEKAARTALSSSNADSWVNSRKIPAWAMSKEYVMINPEDFPPVSSGDSLTIQELDEEERQRGEGYLPPGTKFFPTETRIFIDGKSGKILKRITTEWMNNEDTEKTD